MNTGHLSCGGAFSTENRSRVMVLRGPKEIFAMPNAMADRREAARYPLIVMAEVTVLATGQKLTARTSDVSRSGCYVDTLNPPLSGTPIRLRLTQKGESFETDARVVYVSRGLGMGVRFQEYVSTEQLAILDAWLAIAAQKA
jgi:hypothetical protein